VSAGLWRLMALLLVLVASPASAAGAAAQPEHILGFHSDIRIRSDGSLLITENIQVMAGGEAIKRGIYRDIPTRYTGWYGRVVVPMDVLRVMRNGTDEPHHLEQREKSLRIYVGRSDREIPRGIHDYTITYQTGRQLGFFPGHDELYWNVTGNEWAFPITTATATIRLPQPVGAADIRTEAYTGPQGARDRNYRAGMDAGGAVMFETTAPLARNEGLTVVVGWPKGMVSAPDRQQQLRWWSQDNPEWWSIVTGLAVLLAYYLLAWHIVGRDPPGATIIPRFTPPPNVSAADARYLHRMGFDDQAFAAGIIGLAVKGYLRIEQGAAKTWMLYASDGIRREPLTDDEQALLDSLKLSVRQPFALEQRHHARIQGARQALEAALKKEHLKQNFVTNSRYTIPGLLISAAILAHAALQGGALAPVTFFMLVWLTFWTFGVFMLLRMVAAAWREVARGKWLMVVPALFITAFSVPFLIGEGFGLYMLTVSSSILLTAALPVLAGVNYGFYNWLKAPTLAGRRIYDALAGFRVYLSVAEKDRLDLLHPPALTPEVYERQLPYALALDVENQWSEQFARTLAQSGQPMEHSGYRPAWYHGPAFTGSSAFASGIASSLTGALTSAGSPPGSSSGGGGGGGSSGGGGGGGGGGGW